LSTEFQLFFAAAPSAVRAEYAPPLVPRAELEAQIRAARRAATEELRQQYEAQISDLRTEAVEFHQHLLSQLDENTRTWMSEWEARVPELIFAGVRAVLSEFEMSEEQLQAWVRGTLDEAGASDKSELEVRLSPKNVARLERFWAENALGLPVRARLHAIAGYSEVECRVVGRRGIFDASLNGRLGQLKRLWNLSE
jgi:flagellar biosynthesis/type III secretory pathway protein FliH